MSDWTSFRVENLIDKQLMTIITKWSNESIEILILRDGLEPLKGQANMMTFAESAKNIDKSPEEYFKEITQELSGKDDRVKFSVGDNVLSWKRKAWKRGSLECKSVTNIIDFSRLITDIMTINVNVGVDTSRLKKENMDLRQRTLDLERMLNEMIVMKNSLETELYKKFILLLNSKKMKTRELKQQLKSTNSVYHESTEESENEQENTLKTENFQKSESSQVRLNVNPECAEEVPCNSVFHNISRAIMDNDHRSTESSETLNYDSDESFVLKLSQSPAPRIDHKNSNIDSMDENIEDESTQ